MTPSERHAVVFMACGAVLLPDIKGTMCWWFSPDPWHRGGSDIGEAQQ